MNGTELGLVRAAARDLRGDPWRVLRAGLVLAAVPVVATLCFGTATVGVLVLNPMYTDLLSYETYRSLTGLVAPLSLVATLAVFGALDALLVSAVAADDGFLAALGRVRANPLGVLLGVGGFVAAFWPIRFVVLPRWTLAWTLEGLAVVNGGFGWLPVPAVAAAVGGVAVLSGATFYLTPLAVLDGAVPGRALRANVRLLRETPVVTAVAVVLGVASVLAGLFAFGLGLLLVSLSLGLWVFGLVLLPVALVGLVVGFVCLAVAYAFARTLLVEAYRRGRHRSDRPDRTRSKAPADPS